MSRREGLNSSSGRGNEQTRCPPLFAPSVRPVLGLMAGTLFVEGNGPFYRAQGEFGVCGRLKRAENGPV